MIGLIVCSAVLAAGRAATSNRPAAGRRKGRILRKMDHQQAAIVKQILSSLMWRNDIPRTVCGMCSSTEILEDVVDGEDSAVTEQPLQAIWAERDLQGIAKFRVHHGFGIAAGQKPTL